MSKKRTITSYNLDIYDKNITDGIWQIPIIEKTNKIPSKLIGFNYAKTSKDKNGYIHFFLDDYQFERIWQKPSDYTSILEEYEGVLSPDFSLYTEMSNAIKIWNTYRSRMIGQYLQKCGLNVIPTISWSDETSFSYCFDGIEEGSTICVATIGINKKEEKETFQKGINEAIKKIKPNKLLVYGKKIDVDFHNLEVIWYNNNVLEKVRENYGTKHTILRG